MLLQTEKGLIQINLPKEQLGLFSHSFQSGDTITADVEKEEPHGSPSHPVFRIRFPPKAGPRSFSGRIERLNYALHGEVNGGILDSGDFLHLKPEGASATGLKVGMTVKGRGPSRPMVGGHLVIEAEEVNGTAIHHHKAKKKHGPKHAHPH